jgi:two-component system, NtrC family, response regulator PilR
VGNILVVDDEASICTMLDIALRRDGHRVETVTSGNLAKAKMESALYDVIISDIRMPETTGIEVLKHARKVSPDSAFMLITAHVDAEAAMEAAKAGGVFDFLIKGPAVSDQVKMSVRRAMQSIEIRRQHSAFKRDALSQNSLDKIVGKTPALEAMKTRIRSVAPTNSTVLIYGESGTGKELVARALHGCSPRTSEPFVSVNCGAMPETLLESELFGYVKGAFTGANSNKRGLFETANGGTIFLDEISEMSPAMQVKLLRVLQERTVRPVGGAVENEVDVRVVCAANKELRNEVADGRFREDLYYRISVIPVNVPPLRDRKQDVELLAHHFLKKFASAANKTIYRINAESLAQLTGYEWPGNIRQLENTIERAVALSIGDELIVELPEERPRAKAAAAGANGDAGSNGNGGIPHQGMEQYVAELEKAMLVKALDEAGGVQTKAASLLQLSYRSFRHLMKKYDL